MLIDTHAHLDRQTYAADWPGVLERAKQAGVEQIVVVGTTAAGSAASLQLAREHARLFATVGIHPNHAAEALPEDWDQIAELAADSRCVGIGETGLDRYWDDTPWAVQEDYFDRHLRLSQKLDKAIVIHTRECLGEAIVMLREARQRGPLRGVMHSFTGDAISAAECIDLGLYISFAGMVTYKKNEELRAAAASIPADRLLVETDSPYLAPQPVRGKQNEPAYLVHTAECLALVRKISMNELGELTTANARQLFQLPLL
jgi:TatD DNase family protein